MGQAAKTKYIDADTRTGLGVAGALLESGVGFLLGWQWLSRYPPGPPPPPPPGNIAFRSVIMHPLGHLNPSSSLKLNIGDTVPKYTPSPGDFILAAIAHLGGSYFTISPPVGWTLVRRDDIGMNVGASIWRHVYQSGEYDFIFRFSSSTVCGGVAPIWSNVDTAYPINAVTGKTYPGYETTTITIPSITTTVRNTELFALFSSLGMHGWTVPSGMSHVGGMNSALGLSLDTDRQALPDAGATGERTSTYTSGVPHPSIGQMVALTPKVV